MERSSQSKKFAAEDSSELTGPLSRKLHSCSKRELLACCRYVKLCLLGGNHGLLVARSGTSF